MSKRYDEQSIKVLDSIEAIRKRPGMYIGSLVSGAFHIVKEAIDNGIDEFLAGHSDQIHVELDTKTNTATVTDWGRGIPVKIHAKTGISTLTTIFTQTHAGGKFDKQAYDTAVVGLHGVGVTVSNALSKTLQVWTHREGKCHTQTFERGRPTTEVISGKTAGDWSTRIVLVPDEKIFGSYTKLRADNLRRWLRDLSYLCPKLKIVCVIDGESEEFFSKDGLRDMLKEIAEGESVDDMSKEFAFTGFAKGTDQNVGIDLVMAWTDYDGTLVRQYSNCIYNSEGGTPLDALWDAYVKAVKQSTNETVAAADLRYGVMGILHAKVDNPIYKGQTKDRLENPEVHEIVLTKLVQEFKEFFSRNAGLLKSIVGRAQELGKMREKFKLDKQALKKIKLVDGSSGKGLPAKLVKALNVDAKDRWLYLVEGDSAGGCFLGDTCVRLINGIDKTFEQLVDDAAKGIVNYGYAYSDKAQRIRVVALQAPRVTKHASILVEVTLDNGCKIRCTPDHLWKLRDGTYKAAQDLADGDRLMPHDDFVYVSSSDFYRSWHGRRVVTHPTFDVRGRRGRKYELLAHVVTSSFPHLREQYKKVRDQSEAAPHRHHKDRNKLNDDPHNIEVLSSSAHGKLHPEWRFESGENNAHAIMMRTDSAYRDAVTGRSSRVQTSLWQSDDYRSRQTCSHQQYFKDDTNRQKTKCATDEGMFRKYMSIICSLPLVKRRYFDDAVYIYLQENGHKRLGVSFDYWRYYFYSLKDFRAYVKTYDVKKPIPVKLFDNHVVVNVRRIELKKPVPVYDLTVDRYHNFALSSGVYVHNSAVMARVKNNNGKLFQEVLPLRGKIINASRYEMARVLDNREVQDIINAISSGILDQCQPKKARVGRICLLADPDVDGFHITSLLCSLFVHYMKPLVEAGMVWFVKSPRLVAKHKNDRFFGNSMGALRKQIAANTKIKVDPDTLKPFIVTYLKGHGEATSSEIRQYAMNPVTAKFRMLTLAEGGVDEISRIMGSESDMRKQLLGLL